MGNLPGEQAKMMELGITRTFQNKHELVGEALNVNCDQGC